MITTEQYTKDIHAIQSVNELYMYAGRNAHHFTEEQLDLLEDKVTELFRVEQGYGEIFEPAITTNVVKLETHINSLQ